jgi:hypothetical protein
MATYTRRVGRAIIAACLLAMAVSTAAHASGEAAPQLLATSLVNGWSHDARVISAQYDSVIVRSSSSIVVKDKNGANVNGVTTVASINDNIDPQRAVNDKTILVFTPDSFFNAKLAPYTATMTAHALDQDTTVADTIDTFTFKLDTAAPALTKLDVAPIAAVNGLPFIVGPSDKLSISGIAKDAGASGVSRVELHFYNVVEHLRRHPADTIALSVPPAIRSDVPELAKSVNIACGATCPLSSTFSFADATDGLGLGLWSIKVAPVDLAGNVGAESAAISVLVVRAP